MSFAFSDKSTWHHSAQLALCQPPFLPKTLLLTDYYRVSLLAHRLFFPATTSLSLPMNVASSHSSVSRWLRIDRLPSKADDNLLMAISKGVRGDDVWLLMGLCGVNPQKAPLPSDP